jgi:hypothetical protein
VNLVLHGESRQFRGFTRSLLEIFQKVSHQADSR